MILPESRSHHSFPEIPGYRIVEQLYLGSRTAVYRSIQTAQNNPVVIKVLRREYPSFGELVQFRNQYTIAKNLPIPGIVCPLSLEILGSGYALVMADWGGIALDKYLQQQSLTLTKVLAIAEVLEVAIQLAQILHKLHQNRVIHKDIKPANILIHPDTKKIKLIDFSISSLLPKETQEIKNPNVLEGTLAYLAPEQTGRMNRGIDYRSDFYALGVTLFELLTGKLPFESKDPMELVHCHIAKQPPALASNTEEMPSVLPDIVMKLMAKNAEDRYQSALGLKYDLEICLHQLKETGKIEVFEIGQRDLCDRFLIPEKLYGRETEVQTLLNAFDRVANPPLGKGGLGGRTVSFSCRGGAPVPAPISEIPTKSWMGRVGTGALPLQNDDLPENETALGLGGVEMMLVAGFSGIGKTAVVNEVHKPIVREHGYFIKGKFDQFNRNIPFSAFVQAFRDLMGQLLSESDDRLANWQTKILQALGDNAQVIIEVIPEIEKIIGQQPATTELSGTAAQNRFNLLFQNFIKLFAKPEHPLVIFLDDLQWADSASLQLMQLLMSESEASYLLVIGAYRNNEVSPAHPLMLTIDSLVKAGATVNTITLEPLSSNSLNDLVADTLNCPEYLAKPLTDLVAQKTKGNPFFATQFLKALHQDGDLEFDRTAGYWQCDMVRVREAALTDDVVEFMALQLQKLPPATQNVLKLAACIGNQFDLRTLAVVSEQLITETAADLWKALQEGLILPKSETYKFFLSNESNAPEETNLDRDFTVAYNFLHDRVQQAAYSLIPEDQKQATHHHIGQLLLQQIPPEAREERIFELVNQLNYGTSLITQPIEQEELAKLNLTACRKAKAATAYQVAREYGAVGLSLLAKNAWQEQYPLALALNELAAEVACLNGDFAEMEDSIEAVVQNATSILDCTKVYEAKCLSYIAQNRQTELLAAMLPVLEQLGVKFPAESDPSEFEARLAAIKLYLQDRDVLDLVNLPILTIPEKISAISILAKIWPASYQVRPELSPLIVMEQIDLSLRYGNGELSAFAYATFGLILIGLRGEIELGYEFGQLAFKLLGVLNSKAIESRTTVVFYNFIALWKQHLKETLQPFLTAYASGLETGDLEWAGYGLCNYCINAYFTGFNLNELAPIFEKHIEVLRAIKQEQTIHHISAFRQSVFSLIEPMTDAEQIISKADDCEARIRKYQEENDLFPLFMTCLQQSMLCYLFGNYDRALDYSLRAEKYVGAVVANIGYSQFYFQDSLIHLATCENLAQLDREATIARVNLNQDKVKKWADCAPMNYLHKFNLVEAEKYRVLGKNYEAGDLYDRAIAGAKANDYIQEEALAKELAAKFYLAWGKEKVAAGYMQEAYYGYAQWGATAKVNDLEQRYPHLLRLFLEKAQSFNPLETFRTSSEAIPKGIAAPYCSIHAWTQTGRSSGSSSVNASLDFATILKASGSLSRTIQLDDLLHQLTQIILQNSGADRCALILPDAAGEWEVRAIATPEETQLCHVPLQDNSDLPTKLIYYVKNTQEAVIIDDCKTDLPIIDDYLTQRHPKSILCLPILNQGNLIGILYLKNRLTRGVFTRDRIETLQLLTGQAAIALENARLYQQVETYSQTLEAEVERKTQALHQQNQALQQALQQVQQTQAQLIHAEKMSCLGQMVAGIAHEINNPVNFIKGNIRYTQNYFADLMSLLRLYQQEYPKPTYEIVAKSEEIELDFLIADLSKILGSMETGSDRIQQIVLSLRNFARLDEADLKRVDIHEGIESTLLIVRQRCQPSGKQPQIQVVKDYGTLPRVTCYPSQLNQVFLHIFNNAIDAIRENTTLDSIPEIRIQTGITEDGQIRIQITNTHSFIPENIQTQIFNPFFTTKPVGQGTGLGLSVSYSIIQKHQGTLTVRSQLGEGTEFQITIAQKVYPD